MHIGIFARFLVSSLVAEDDLQTFEVRGEGAVGFIDGGTVLSFSGAFDDVAETGNLVNSVRTARAFQFMPEVNDCGEIATIEGFANFGEFFFLVSEKKGKDLFRRSRCSPKKIPNFLTTGRLRRDRGVTISPCPTRNLSSYWYGASCLSSLSAAVRRLNRF